jgi:hypothetical protein
MSISITGGQSALGRLLSCERAAGTSILTAGTTFQRGAP